LYKKLLIAIVALILLILLINVGLNFWIARQLPGIINENNDSPYHITYQELTVSLLDKNIFAREIILVPKASLTKTEKKAGLYANIRTVQIADFNLWDLLFTRKIRAKKLHVIKPEITFYKEAEEEKKKEKRSIKSEVVEPFGKIIYVSDVFIEEGLFQMIPPNATKASLTARNVSMELEGILVSERTLKEKIPFEFKKYSLGCDSIDYLVSRFYRVKAKHFKTSGDSLKIDGLALIPRLGRKAFISVIPKEKDLYSVNVKGLTIAGLYWGFGKKGFSFRSKAVTLDGVNADIYRGKMPPDDMSEKKLYSKILREMKFDMRIDTLRLRNSKIVYEEEKDIEKGAGKLVFGNLNMLATAVNSGYGKSELPDVNINVSARFMNISPMRVVWSFNVLDQNDRFRIRGSIFDFPAEGLAPFTKPYSNTIVEGNMDEVYFDFRGDRNNSQGTFGLNYDDLKVKVFRKNDRRKKNKIVSAIANLFVKNDSKEKVKKTDVSVTRIKEKSFFNLLWLSLSEGLRKILL
jgi:hypothetical protein